jgi:hypothetical protein
MDNEKELNTDNLEQLLSLFDRPDDTINQIESIYRALGAGRLSYDDAILSAESILKALKG